MANRRLTIDEYNAEVMRLTGKPPQVDIFAQEQFGKPEKIIEAQQQLAVEKAQEDDYFTYKDPITGEEVLTPPKGLEDVSLDMVDVATAGGAAIGAYGGKKIADWMMPKVPYTEFGKGVQKLQGYQKDKLEGILDTVEKAGATRLNESALKKLTTNLGDIPSRSESSRRAIADISEKKASAHKRNELLYEVADKRAANITGIIPKNIFDNLFSKESKDDVAIFNRIQKDKAGSFKETRAYNYVQSVLDSTDNSSVADLERTRKLIGEKLGDSDDSEARAIYKRAMDRISDVQDEALKKHNMPNLYKDARKDWQELQRDYYGRDMSIEVQEGKTGGKSIKSLLESGKTEDVANILLGKDLDINKVKEASKILDDNTKRDLAFESLTQGMRRPDSGNIFDNVENVDIFINNYKGKSEALKILLGDSEKELDKTVDALKFVSGSLKKLSGDDKHIAEDVIGLIGSVAAIKFSPLYAGKTAWYNVRGILRKLFSGKDRDEFIARIKEVKNPKLREGLRKAFTTTMAGVGAIGGYEATSEASKELGLSKSSPLEKIGQKFSGATLREELLGR